MVPEINALEPAMQQRSDAELRQLTDTFRKRLADGQTLDDLLAEALRGGARGQRPHPRQAPFRRAAGRRGGDARGHIAEMKTGEGKTLVSTLPAYLNALPGEGVHIVTVNDYLARRDAEWMGVIHRFLGLEVGVVLATMQPQERRPAYDADITYGTNNEFGFDYLRDNMAVFVEDLVQRGHAYAIVDEVDSILVDEARTPLIISGATEQGHRWYQQFARLSPRLHRDTHYEVDEGKHTVAINEAGIARSRSCSRSRTSTTRSTPLVHHLQNAIRAKELYKRDDEYIVRDGEVLIVDEFTGRCWRAAAPRGCTRPSRPRSRSRSRRRTRPTPPSPCRTTSGCTTRSPA